MWWDCSKVAYAVHNGLCKRTCKPCFWINVTMSLYSKLIDLILLFTSFMQRPAVKWDLHSWPVYVWRMQTYRMYTITLVWQMLRVKLLFIWLHFCRLHNGTVYATRSQTRNQKWICAFFPFINLPQYPFTTKQAYTHLHMTPTFPNVMMYSSQHDRLYFCLWRLKGLMLFLRMWGRVSHSRIRHCCPLRPWLLIHGISTSACKRSTE